MKGKPQKRWACLARAAVTVFAILLFVFVASRLAAPYIVSSNLVRGSMERAISRWSGHDVDIRGTPSLRFWPEPRIILPEVTISDRRNGERRVLAEIAELSAGFGLIKAALGHPVFDDFRLSRPLIRLNRTPLGRLQWGGEGLLTEAIAEARDKGTAVRGGPHDSAVGSITIENGRIELQDQGSGRMLTLDSIFSDITWPVMSAPIRGTATMLLGGAVTRIDFSAPEPLMLFAGAVTDMQVKLSAPSVNGTFSGKAGLFPARFAEGKLSVDVSDVHGLLGWAGMELPGTGALHKIYVETTATAEPDRLRLEDLSFTANDATASGVLDISNAKSGKPKVSGTLAFQQMDIANFLGAFSLSIPDSSAREGRSGLLDWLEFDLSLSARSASLAQLTLTDVGASILATDGSVAFDIADSTLAGGTLTGHLEGRDGGFDQGARLDVSLTNADLSDIEARLALSGPLPLGTGSLTLSASTDVALWQTSGHDISGKVQLQAGPGRLSRFNPQGIQALATARPFFRLAEAGSGDMAFDTLDMSAELTGGTIDIRSGKLADSTRSLTFSGVVPYDFKGLALSAEMQSTAESPGSLRFFIGGSWPDLILSPVTPKG
ncbi:AsmA family protein [Rhizobium paknamense]|uniref:AsmA protein n=1 Tax=Rhizobium paknamense TaxID=1206817 RepID=A0ABU0ILR0_9HYPH|nr:AsmA-like C-terminal region-containing protein [Rhizobium paknamense]MDQ0458124.1 AsmA protein [Rhizobium paknamense]